MVRHPSSPLRAFSLIELIGVLAILTILAAMTAPGVIRQLDQAARTKERMDLVAISNAIVLQVLNNKSIPSAANLPHSAAAWARVPLNEVTSNRRRYGRAFLLDTSGFFATYGSGYTQTWAGAISPTNARMVVLGTIATPLPATPGAFTNIWDTPADARPGTWTSSTWAGKGEDLFIQRINLTPLFHRLILVNRDTLNIPRFAIDGSVTTNVPSGGAGWDRYYLDGTAVSLCDSTGAPKRKIVLTQDESFLFDGNTWSDYVVTGGSNELLANEFADLATKFLDRDWPSNAHQGADQQGALTSMFNFMLVYTLWANQCPHFPRHGITGSGTSVPEYQMLQQIEGGGTGNNAFGRLNEFTGPNGLLDH